MQDRPSLEAMLGAVARFLDQEAAPAASDAALAFRLRVAGHLVAMAGREVHREALDDAADLDALEALLAIEAPLTPAERRDRVARRQAVAALERVVQERVIAGEYDDEPAAFLAAMRGRLRRKLEVANPRFDLADDLP